MLDDLQLDQIADPQVREVMRRLMNMVEQLSAENQRLREENNCLKGEQGQPTFPKARPKPTDHSSDAERRVPRGRVKRAKNATISIDREETRKVDRDILPPDAEFKGYEAVIVQDVTFHTDNVRFCKEKWYAPSQQRTYLADLPAGYDGQFGPTLKALIWIWYFASQMTEPKWVHDGRHYQKLRPRFAAHLTALTTFERDYWAFYSVHPGYDLTYPGLLSNYSNLAQRALQYIISAINRQYGSLASARRVW